MKALSLPFVSGAVTIAIACKNPTPTPQGIVVADITPVSGPCGGAGGFLWMPHCEVTQCNGPDTNDATKMTASGTDDFQLECSIVPQADNFQVAVTIHGNVTMVSDSGYGPFPAVVKISGLFSPRATTTSPMTNITMEFEVTDGVADHTLPLAQSTCTAEYVYPDNGTPGSALPALADTVVDDSGGRIWVSIFCDAATNLAPQIAGMSGCALDTIIRLENCATSP